MENPAELPRIPEQIKNPPQKEGITKYGPEEYMEQKSAYEQIIKGLNSGLYTKKEIGDDIEVKDDGGRTVFLGPSENLERALTWLEDQKDKGNA